MTERELARAFRELARSFDVFRTVCERIIEARRTNEGMLLDSTEVVVLEMALRDMAFGILKGES